MRQLLHEFNYVGGRPFINLKVRGNSERERYFSFLVDSGADYSILPKSRALLLDIDFDRPDEIKEIQFANGEVELAKKFFITVILGYNEMLIPIFVVEKESDCLLGRAGIFDHFDVCFRQKDQKVVFMKN